MDTKKTVLIVDDNAMVLESIDLLLSVTGDFQTIRARGSADAADNLSNTQKIDVIVADVVLAGSMTGIDISQKAIGQYPAIAVVVITADPEVHCAEIPARGIFLRKPFGGEQLLAAIEDALEKARVDSP